MPRKTAKPALMVEKRGNMVLLTVFKVSNMKRFRVGSVAVPFGDRQAMFDALAPIYEKLRGKPQR